MHSKLQKNYLSSFESELNKELLIEPHKKDYKFGWLFFYQTKKYISTGSISDMLIGNAPFIVEKSTGDIFILGTEKPIKKYIQEGVVKKAGIV